jgi:hypothetical protein
MRIVIELGMEDVRLSSSQKPLEEMGLGDVTRRAFSVACLADRITLSDGNRVCVLKDRAGCTKSRGLPEGDLNSMCPESAVPAPGLTGKRASLKEVPWFKEERGVDELFKEDWIAENKQPVAKAGCQHEFVNVGFTSVTMACKVCGRSM